jgi:hypothetical protein
MTTTRELIQRLVDAIETTESPGPSVYQMAVVDEARTYLAQPEWEGPTGPLVYDVLARRLRYESELAEPEPAGPTDDELDELWADIDGGGAIWAWQPYAREVLKRWGRQVPL